MDSLFFLCACQSKLQNITWRKKDKKISTEHDLSLNHKPQQQQQQQQQGKGKALSEKLWDFAGKCLT